MVIDRCCPKPFCAQVTHITGVMVLLDQLDFFQAILTTAKRYKIKDMFQFLLVISRDFFLGLAGEHSTPVTVEVINYLHNITSTS